MRNAIRTLSLLAMIAIVGAVLTPSALAKGAAGPALARCARRRPGPLPGASPRQDLRSPDALAAAQGRYLGMSAGARPTASLHAPTVAGSPAAEPVAFDWSSAALAPPPESA
jgi:hypothetical protein